MKYHITSKEFELKFEDTYWTSWYDCPAIKMRVKFPTGGIRYKPSWQALMIIRINFVDWLGQK